MRAEFQKKIDVYSAALKVAEPLEMMLLRQEFNSWYSARSPEEREEMKPYWDENLRHVNNGLAEVRELLTELETIVEQEKRERLLKASA